MKEIGGLFVDDPDCNDAVRVLKMDKCEDVNWLVHDIQNASTDEPITMESFI